MNASRTFISIFISRHSISNSTRCGGFDAVSLSSLFAGVFAMWGDELRWRNKVQSTILNTTFFRDEDEDEVITKILWKSDNRSSITPRAPRTSCHSLHLTSHQNACGKEVIMAIIKTIDYAGKENFLSAETELPPGSSGV